MTCFGFNSFAACITFVRSAFLTLPVNVTTPLLTLAVMPLYPFALKTESSPFLNTSSGLITTGLGGGVGAVSVDCGRFEWEPGHLG